MSTIMDMPPSAQENGPLPISCADNYPQWHRESPPALETYQQQWQALLARLQQGQLLQEQRLSCLQELRESVCHLEQLPLLDSLLDTEQWLVSMELLITVSTVLCDWVLIIYIYEQLLAKNKVAPNRPSRDNNIFPLLNAYKQTGRFDLAQTHLEKALLLDPNNQYYYGYWQALVADNKGSLLDYLIDGDIALTPLSEEHLESFSWQYNNRVSSLCNLPDFTQDDEWLHWFSNVTSIYHHRERVAAFGIIHSDWGFMGSVHLKVVNGIGFFYYWLGNDFQGYGYGPRAVNLLLHYGYEVLGMSCCYAKVYKDNFPSHKAMKKIGFKALPFTAAKPDDHEVFYYLGDDKKNNQLFLELQQLMNYLDGFLTVLPNQCISIE